MKIFTETFIDLMPPRGHVLDVGAHTGKYGAIFVEKGFTVTAVEKRFADPKIAGVAWNQSPVEAWVANLPPEASFDGIFMKNVLQFVDKSEAQTRLLPALLRHLNPGGVIAIESFFAEPMPRFKGSMTSLWTAKELATLVAGLDLVLVTEEEDQHLSMQNTMHAFSMSQVIARKKAV